MKKKTERDTNDESLWGAAPRKAVPRTRLQEAFRRRHMLGLIHWTRTSGITNELIDFLRMFAGKATHGRSLTDGPPWSTRDLQPDEYVEVPQDLLILIADILSGEVPARYKKKRKHVDILRPGALHDRKAALKKQIRHGLDDTKVRAETWALLKAADWPRDYPEGRSAIAAAVTHLLLVEFELQGHPDALRERLKLTPRTSKRGKSATDIPTEILRKKKATL